MSTSVSMSVDAPLTSSQLTRSLDAMDYPELDQYVTSGLTSARDSLLALEPYLRAMREMLHDQGRRNDLRLERGVPEGLTWQAWVNSKKSMLGSLSTVNRLLRGEQKAKSKNEKPKHLTALEHRLLGTATNVHEALLDIGVGRIDDAVAKLKEKLPTKEKIHEHLERGIELTILSPAGLAEPEPQEEASLTSAVEYKRRYFDQASDYFWDRYYYAFQSSPFKKVIKLLDNGSDEKIRANADDFATLSSELRQAAKELSLLASRISERIGVSDRRLQTEGLNSAHEKPCSAECGMPAGTKHPHLCDECFLRIDKYVRRSEAAVKGWKKRNSNSSR